MVKFDSSKHPRGQPDNAGQFIKKGQSAGESSSRYNGMTAVELKKRQTIDLSQSEWKRYYDTIGDIKAGNVEERKVKNGRWVVLNVNVENDGTRTPARLVLDNGKYVSPKVMAVLTFETDDKMYDALYTIERHYEKRTSRS